MWLEGDVNHLIALHWLNRTDTPLRFHPEGPGGYLTNAMLDKLMDAAGISFSQAMWKAVEITDRATAKYSGPLAPCLEALQLTVKAAIAQFRVRAVAAAHNKAIARAHLLSESRKHYNVDPTD